MSSCKKFDEGGTTWRIKARIPGTYSLEFESIRGIDSTYYMQTLSANKIEISVPDKGDTYYLKHNDQLVGQFYFKAGTRMKIECSAHAVKSIFRGENQFIIERFKKKEFWLKSNGEEIFIKLKAA